MSLPRKAADAPSRFAFSIAARTFLIRPSFGVAGRRGAAPDVGAFADAAEEAEEEANNAPAFGVLLCHAATLAIFF